MASEKRVSGRPIEEAEILPQAVAELDRKAASKAVGLGVERLPDGYAELLLMRSLGEAYPSEAIVKQVVSQIPWGHNIRLLQMVKDHGERLWYARQTVEHGWSRNVLDFLTIGTMSTTNEFFGTFLG